MSILQSLNRHRKKRNNENINLNFYEEELKILSDFPYLHEEKKLTSSIQSMEILFHKLFMFFLPCKLRSILNGIINC